MGGYNCCTADIVVSVKRAVEEYVRFGEEVSIRVRTYRLQTHEG